jgi:hypothetical protein
MNRRALILSAILAGLILTAPATANRPATGVEASKIRQKVATFVRAHASLPERDGFVIVPVCVSTVNARWAFVGVWPVNDLGRIDRRVDVVRGYLQRRVSWSVELFGSGDVGQRDTGLARGLGTSVAVVRDLRRCDWPPRSRVQLLIDAAELEVYPS